LGSNLYPQQTQSSWGPSVNTIELNRYIRSVVRLCTNLGADAVRPANQDGPTSGDLFATVLLMQENERGWAEVSQENIDGDPQERIKEKATAQIRFTASIQFFRTGALDVARKLKNRIQMTDAQDLLTQYGLGLVTMSDIRNLTAVENEISEERGQLDIDFHLINEEETIVNTFGVFPIDVKMGTAKSEPLNNTFEVYEP
jgi:hypothetical protein